MPKRRDQMAGPSNVPPEIASIDVAMAAAAKRLGPAADVAAVWAEVERARVAFCRSHGCWRYRGLKSCTDVPGRPRCDEAKS